MYHYSLLHIHDSLRFRIIVLLFFRTLLFLLHNSNYCAMCFADDGCCWSHLENTSSSCYIDQVQSLIPNYEEEMEIAPSAEETSNVRPLRMHIRSTVIAWLTRGLTDEIAMFECGQCGIHTHIGN